MFKRKKILAWEYDNKVAERLQLKEKLARLKERYGQLAGLQAEVDQAYGSIEAKHSDLETLRDGLVAKSKQVLELAKKAGISDPDLEQMLEVPLVPALGSLTNRRKDYSETLSQPFDVLDKEIAALPSEADLAPVRGKRLLTRDGYVQVNKQECEALMAPRVKELVSVVRRLESGLEVKTGPYSYKPMEEPLNQSLEACPSEIEYDTTAVESAFDRVAYSAGFNAGLGKVKKTPIKNLAKKTGLLSSYERGAAYGAEVKKETAKLKKTVAAVGKLSAEAKLDYGARLNEVVMALEHQPLSERTESKANELFEKTIYEAGFKVGFGLISGKQIESVAEANNLADKYGNGITKGQELKQRLQETVDLVDSLAPLRDTLHKSLIEQALVERVETDSDKSNIRNSTIFFDLLYQLNPDWEGTHIKPKDKTAIYERLIECGQVFSNRYLRYDDMDDSVNAIRFFEFARKLKPKTPEAHIKLAEAHATKEEYSIALAHFKKADKFARKRKNDYVTKSIAELDEKGIEEEPLDREAVSDKGRLFDFLTYTLAEDVGPAGITESVEQYEQTIKKFEPRIRQGISYALGWIGAKACDGIDAKVYRQAEEDKGLLETYTIQSVDVIADNCFISRLYKVQADLIEALGNKVASPREWFVNDGYGFEWTVENVPTEWADSRIPPHFAYAVAERSASMGDVRGTTRVIAEEADICTFSYMFNGLKNPVDFTGLTKSGEDDDQINAVAFLSMQYWAGAVGLIPLDKQFLERTLSIVNKSFEFRYHADKWIGVDTKKAREQGRLEAFKGVRDQPLIPNCVMMQEKSYETDKGYVRWTRGLMNSYTDAQNDW